MIVKTLCKQNIIQDILYNRYTLICSTKKIIETGLYLARANQFKKTLFV